MYAHRCHLRRKIANFPAWKKGKPNDAFRSSLLPNASPCCTWLQLVAPGCSYREKIGRGACEPRNLELAT